MCILFICTTTVLDWYVPIWDIFIQSTSTECLLLSLKASIKWCDLLRNVPNFKEKTINTQLKMLSNTCNLLIINIIQIMLLMKEPFVRGSNGKSILTEIIIYGFGIISISVNIELSF